MRKLGLALLCAVWLVVGCGSEDEDEQIACAYESRFYMNCGSTSEPGDWEESCQMVSSEEVCDGITEDDSSCEFGCCTSTSYRNVRIGSNCDALLGTAPSTGSGGASQTGGTGGTPSTGGQSTTPVDIDTWVADSPADCFPAALDGTLTLSQIPPEYPDPITTASSTLPVVFDAGRLASVHGFDCVPIPDGDNVNIIDNQPICPGCRAYWRCGPCDCTVQRYRTGSIAGWMLECPYSSMPECPTPTYAEWLVPVDPGPSSCILEDIPRCSTAEPCRFDYTCSGDGICLLP